MSRLVTQRKPKHANEIIQPNRSATFLSFVVASWFAHSDMVALLVLLLLLQQAVPD